MAFVANGINGTAGKELTCVAKADPEDLFDLGVLDEPPCEGRRKGIRRKDRFTERIYLVRTADRWMPR